MTDIVDEILVKVQEIDDGLTPEKALKIETAIRKAYGGSRVYVRQASKVEQQKIAEKVTRDYLDGSVEQVTSKHGISRATMYRMIKR